MQRKLIKVGTSAAVLVPKEVLEDQNVKIGDVLEVEFSKTARPDPTVVDPSLLASAEKIMKRYDVALKKLASS